MSPAYGPERYVRTMAPNIARDLTVGRDELLAFIRPRHHGILTTTRASGAPAARRR